jgi:hypothetical protein
MTVGVASALSPEDVAFIYTDLMVAVLEEEGLDYIQVYASDDGRAFMTAGVSRELAPEEIATIVRDLQAFIREKNGIDYVQHYESDDGRRVFCICQLSHAMKASDEYAPEDDYWTLLLLEEY